MDAKKRLLTILAMVGVIVFTLLIILFLNQSKLSQPTTAKPENTQQVVLEEDGKVKGANLQGFLKDDSFFDEYKKIEEPQSAPQEEEEDVRFSFVPTEELADVSFLIHSEDEINVLEEDAEATNEMEIDGDDTRQDILLSSSGNGNAVVLGIDVSKWNKEIDWEKVREQGIKFAIIRCGYRGSASGWLVEDPCFYKNIKGAKEAGIEVGVYFFTQAIDEKEAKEEAKTVLSLLGEEEIQYPVFIDTEGAGGKGRADGLDEPTRTLVCKAFCEEIEKAGLKAGIYASCNWFTHNLNFKELDQFVIWLAEYRSTPQFGEYYDMWQYTSKGSVNGISGNVDLNVSYLGLAN